MRNVNSITQKRPSNTSRISYDLFDQLDTPGIDGKIESFNNDDAEHISNGEQEKEPAIFEYSGTNDVNDISSSEDV